MPVANCKNCNEIFEQCGFRKSEWSKPPHERVCNSCYDQVNSLTCTVCEKAKTLNHFAADNRHAPKCAQCVMDSKEMFCFTCECSRHLCMFAKINRRAGCSKCNYCVELEQEEAHEIEEEDTRPDLYLSSESSSHFYYSSEDEDILYEVD